MHLPVVDLAERAGRSSTRLEKWSVESASWGAKVEGPLECQEGASQPAQSGPETRSTYTATSPNTPITVR